MESLGGIVHDALVLLSQRAGPASFDLLLAQTKKVLGMEMNEHHAAILDAYENPDAPPEPTPEQLLAEWRKNNPPKTKDAPL